MTPLEHIREGIRTGDWPNVCAGFAALTGEKLSPPVCGTVSREGVEEAHRLLGEFLAGPRPEPEPQRPRKPESKPKPKPKPKQKQKRAEPEPDQDHEPAQANDPLDRFRVNNGDPGRRLSGAQPWAPPGENLFVDDGTISSELVQDSKHASKNQKPTEGSREPFKEIDLTCAKCNKTFTVHPGLRPVKLDDEDQEYAWKCDRCVGGR